MEIVSVSLFSNFWKLHGYWESTVINAMRMRGHECVQYLCDGVFPICDLHFETVDPRPGMTCQQHQVASMGLAESMGIPSKDMCVLLDRSDFQAARSFAEETSLEKRLDCKFGDWPVGEWRRSSVQVHFRSSRLDLGIREQEDTFRQYVQTTRLASIASERIIDLERPDALWLFNSRMWKLFLEKWGRSLETPYEQGYPFPEAPSPATLARIAPFHLSTITTWTNPEGFLISRKESR